MITSGPSRQAMVLSGGGGYGAYEVGVMSALFNGESPATEYRPLEVDMFAGTSVGAINSAIMVAHAADGLANGVAHLTHIWRNEIANSAVRCGNGVYRFRGVPLELLDRNCLAEPFGILSNVTEDLSYFFRESLRRGSRFMSSRASFTRRSLELLDLSALVDSDAFYGLVRDAVPLDRLSHTDKQLKVITTNFDTGEMTVFTSHDIAERVGHAAILASAAVPGFFPPVQIDGEMHIDGGTLMNTPILPAVHGADVLHVVYMDPDIENIPVEYLQSTIGVVDRLLVTSFAFAINRDIESIQDFNRSLELVEAAEANPRMFDERFQPLLRLASGVYQQIQGSTAFTTTTIHRYHPRDDLGGSLGFLNFDYDHINQLIERGYEDAVNHDCEASGCTFAHRGPVA
ncbi:MAG TPA: patatin-like phospholipase family protein [Pirellulaceae bacterium]|nr:patatin-like phospholipase family protein [Pirellulaceae bacterium]